MLKTVLPRSARGTSVYCTHLLRVTRHEHAASLILSTARTVILWLAATISRASAPARPAEGLLSPRWSQLRRVNTAAETGARRTRGSPILHWHPVPRRARQHDPAWFNRDQGPVVRTTQTHSPTNTRQLSTRSCQHRLPCLYRRAFSTASKTATGDPGFIASRAPSASSHISVSAAVSACRIPAVMWS